MLIVFSCSKKDIFIDANNLFANNLISKSQYSFLLEIPKDSIFHYDRVILPEELSHDWVSVFEYSIKNKGFQIHISSDEFVLAEKVKWNPKDIFRSKKYLEKKYLKKIIDFHHTNPETELDWKDYYYRYIDDVMEINYRGYSLGTIINDFDNLYILHEFRKKNILFGEKVLYECFFIYKGEEYSFFHIIFVDKFKDIYKYLKLLDGEI